MALTLIGSPISYLFADATLPFTRHAHECASRIADARGHTKLMTVGSNR